MTQEEVKDAAIKYRDSVIADDKAFGYTRKDLNYGDIKYAFIAGAQWYHDAIVKHCTPEFNVEPKIDVDETISFISGFIRENNYPPTLEDFILNERNKHDND